MFIRGISVPKGFLQITKLFGGTVPPSNIFAILSQNAQNAFELPPSGTLIGTPMEYLGTQVPPMGYRFTPMEIQCFTLIHQRKSIKVPRQQSLEGQIQHTTVRTLINAYQKIHDVCSINVSVQKKRCWQCDHFRKIRDIHTR